MLKNVNIKTNVMALLLVSSMAFSCSSKAQKSNLDVTAFEKGMATQTVQLLDVRTAGEYESGHLKNALQADWNRPDQFKQRVKALDKKTPVYTYCLSGARSGAAVAWLRQNGYTAYNMEGGIKNWNKEGKPLEQIAAVPQMSLAAYLLQIPADKTVLVDFGAEWCPPCKTMEPVLADLQKSHGTKFMLIKVDGASQKDLVKELNIEEFPTFIVYKNGKAVWKKTGLMEKAELIEQL